MVNEKLNEYAAKHQSEADKLSESAKIAFEEDRTVSVFKWMNSLAAAHKEFVSELFDISTLLDNGITIQRWITVSDRLPIAEYEEHRRRYDTDPDFIVVIEGAAEATVLSFHKDTDGRYYWNDGEYVYPVSHWMHLPQVPREGAQ